jgi:hypothetical protein
VSVDSVKDLTQADYNRIRDELVAFFNTRNLDGSVAVTLLVMAAAQAYVQMMREDGYDPAGFASTADVALRVALGGRPS